MTLCVTTSARTEVAVFDPTVTCTGYPPRPFGAGLHDEDVRRNPKPLRQRGYLADVELPFAFEHG